MFSDKKKQKINSKVTEKGKIVTQKKNIWQLWKSIINF